MFFVATSAASLFGALVHGFYSDNKFLWQAVLIALGIVSASTWAVGAHLLFTDGAARFVTVAALIELAVYSLVVLFVTDNFAIAIANYLPSTVFLIAAFFVSYRSTAATPVALGLAGLLLTLVAAGVQQARIAVHPTYFNHNALYHVLQAVALFLIFRTAAFLSVLVPGS